MSLPKASDYLTNGFAIFSDDANINSITLGYRPYRVFRSRDSVELPLYMKVPQSGGGFVSGRVMDFFSAQYYPRVNGLTEVASMVSEDGTFQGVRVIRDFRGNQQTGYRDVTFSTSPLGASSADRGLDRLEQSDDEKLLARLPQPPALFEPFILNADMQLYQEFDGSFSLLRRTWAFPENMTVESDGKSYRVLYRLEPVYDDKDLPDTASATYNTHWFVGFEPSGGRLVRLNHTSVTKVAAGS